MHPRSWTKNIESQSTNPLFLLKKIVKLTKDRWNEGQLAVHILKKAEKYMLNFLRQTSPSFSKIGRLHCFRFLSFAMICLHCGAIVINNGFTFSHKHIVEKRAQRR